MRTTIEPLEGNRVKVSIEVDEAEFERAVDAAFRRIAREVRIPGFRPGKAPRRLLEARLGSEVGREEALRESLPVYYAQAVKDNELDTIAAPTIDITGGKDTGPVAFDAVVELRPQVSIAGYGGLRVTVNRPEASEEDITAQVDRLREQFADLVAVQRPAAKGDFVSINIHGSREGEPVPGLIADDYLYELGSGRIATELDENLRAAKVGDVLEFDADDPEPGQSPVHFRVLVKDVKEKVLPALDDEWVNEASEFDTVDELRADIAERITKILRVQATLALREKTAQAVAELVEDDVPKPLIDDEVRQRLQDLSLRLSAQGIAAVDYLQAVGKSQEELVADLRPLAMQAAKVDLALRAVADAETIEATDEDLDDEYARLAERLRQKPEKVRRQFERNDQVPAVRSDIRKRKALEWLLEHVEVVDESGQPIDRATLQLETDENAEAADDHTAEAPDEDSQ